MSNRNFNEMPWLVAIASALALEPSVAASSAIARTALSTRSEILTAPTLPRCPAAFPEPENRRSDAGLPLPQRTTGAGHADARAAFARAAVPSSAGPDGPCDKLWSAEDRRASSETRARERTSVLAAFMTPTVVTPSSIQTKNTYNRTMHDSYFVHDDRRWMGTQVRLTRRPCW